MFTFFNIYSADTDYLINSVTGTDILPYKIGRILFFLLLLLLLLLLFCLPALTEKKCGFSAALKAFASVLCAVCLAVSFIPTSKCYIEKIDYKDEHTYYANINKSFQPADFTIEKYDMSFYVKNNLSAITSLSISPSNLKDYSFTLYHGYKIKSVTDSNGNPLEFTQNADYITVKNTTGNLSNIIFSYSGSNFIYFSNYQGIMLSGGFAYYPHAGMLDNTFINNSSSYTMLKNEPKAYFRVSFDYGKEVFCNLPSVGENIFEGTSDCLTLLSGFITYINVDGTRAVYSYAATFFGDDKTVKENLEKLHNNPLYPSRPLENVFCLQLQTAPVFASHMEAAGIIDLYTTYEKQLVNPDKIPLAEMLRVFIEGKNTFNANYESAVAEQIPIDSGNTFSICIIIHDITEKYGDNKGIEMLQSYLYNNDDTRSPSEFFADMG